MSTLLESLSESSTQLSLLLSKHKGRIIIYTGAGISTSAAIPDYRGTNGLYKRPGPMVRNMKIRLPEASVAKPTYTHMAIRSLVENGYVRHVVSQNIDSLHLRSGIPLEKLSEMHGNLFAEKCQSCRSIMYRNFDAAEQTERWNHFSGRICPFCCDPETASTLRSSITELASTFANKECSVDVAIATIKRATKIISRNYAQEIGKPAPLLCDLIVHYGEHIDNDHSVNRIPSAIKAIMGERDYREYILEAAKRFNRKRKSSEETPANPVTGGVFASDSQNGKILKKRHSSIPLSNRNTSMGLNDSLSSIPQGYVTDEIKPEFTRTCAHPSIKTGSNYLDDDGVKVANCSVSKTAEMDLLSMSATLGTFHQKAGLAESLLSTTTSHSMKPNSDDATFSQLNEEPVSLIMVIGSSLTVLKGYSFLWPLGLGRCLHASTVPKRIPLRRARMHSDTEDGSCELAIINLQETCKDGIATFVSHLPCDDLLRETIEGHLGLTVPSYDPETDPLRILCVPLVEEEEITRSRPDLFQLW